MKTTVRVATLFASRQAESSPSVAIFFEKVVMNAVERAPSAKRSRSMLGTRNAMRNASRFLPAPKSAAKSTSRIRPRRRLQRMAMPTTPVARVLTRLFAGIAASFTAQQNSGVAPYESGISGSCRSVPMATLGCGKAAAFFLASATGRRLQRGVALVSAPGTADKQTRRR